MPKAPIDRELIHQLPKSDLHLHLDGSLRLDTLLELAKVHGVKLPSRTKSGLLELVFKRAYKNLPEYLRGFEFTVACLQDAESLERAAYELCLDCRQENVFYAEIRFAPQLHVRGAFQVRDVLRAVCKGVERAKKTINAEAAVRRGELPRFEAGVIVCAMRFFLPVFSAALPRLLRDDGARAPPSRDLRRSPPSSSLGPRSPRREEEDGVPVVGFDLAGQERGFPGRRTISRGLPTGARALPREDRPRW